MCSLIASSHTCSLIASGHTCSLIASSHTCSLIASNLTNSLIDSSHTCFLIASSHICSLIASSHVFSDIFKSHVFSDSFKSHMFCSVITLPGWSAAVSEIPAYSLWCDRRLVNIFVPVPLSVQELPNIQVYGGEGSHILRQCKGWFTPQYISAVSCAHSDIKEAVGGKCNKKDSNDAYTR